MNLRPFTNFFTAALLFPLTKTRQLGLRLAGPFWFYEWVDGFFGIPCILKIEQRLMM